MDEVKGWVVVGAIDFVAPQTLWINQPAAIRTEMALTSIHHKCYLPQESGEHLVYPSGLEAVLSAFSKPHGPAHPSLTIRSEWAQDPAAKIAK